MATFLPLIVLLCVWTSHVLSVPLNKRIFIIVLDNQTLNSTLGDPRMAALAQKGQLLMNYVAVGDSLLANYVALVGGDDFGIIDNNRRSLIGDCLANLLLNKAVSWRSYLEDYPGQCFDGDQSRNYVRWHNPFLYFNSVRMVASLCSNLQNLKPLFSDLINNSPQYSLFVPNLLHTSSVSVSSNFTSDLVNTLIPIFTQNAIIVVTCAGAASGQPLFTLVIDPSNPSLAGTKDYTPYNHYSLLKSVEVNFDLGSLGRQDQSANAIAYIATGTIVPQPASGGGSTTSGNGNGSGNGGANGGTTGSGNSGSGSGSGNGNGNGSGNGNGNGNNSGNGGEGSGTDNSSNGRGSSTGRQQDNSGSTGLLEDVQASSPGTSSLPTGVALAVALVAFCCVVACGIVMIRRLHKGSRRRALGKAAGTDRNSTQQTLLPSGSNKPSKYSNDNDPDADAHPVSGAGGGREFSVSEDPYARGDVAANHGDDVEIDADEMQDVSMDSDRERNLDKVMLAYHPGTEVPMKTIYPVQEISEDELHTRLAQGPMEREMKEPTLSMTSNRRNQNMLP